MKILSFDEFWLSKVSSQTLKKIECEIVKKTENSLLHRKLETKINLYFFNSDFSLNSYQSQIKFIEFGENLHFFENLKLQK